MPARVDVPVARVGAPAAVPPIRSAAPPSARLSGGGCAVEGRVAGVALGVDGTPAGVFAVVRHAESVRVTFGSKAGGASGVTLEHHGLRFDAQLAADGVSLFARTPLALGGVFDPDPDAPLRWRLGEGQPVVRYEPQLGEFTLVGSLEKAVSCTDIGLEGAAFPERRAYTKHWATAGPKCGVAASPGGPPVLELPSGSVVSVLGDDKQSVHVAFRTQQGLVTGWVPQGAVTKRAPPPGGTGYGTGHGRVAKQSFPGGHLCRAPLPLYVRKVVGEVVAQVGEVKAGVRVALAPADPAATYRSVAAEQRRHSHEASWLTLAPGFELVVDQQASRDCAPIEDSVQVPTE